MYMYMSMKIDWIYVFVYFMIIIDFINEIM